MAVLVQEDKFLRKGRVVQGIEVPDQLISVATLRRAEIKPDRFVGDAFEWLPNRWLFRRYAEFA